MQKRQFSALTISGLLTLYPSINAADDNWDWLNLLNRKDVAAVENKLYAEECGACHFAYQPGFLPERSWRKLMGGLGDHFGDNAELEADVISELLDYMVQNAADHSKYKHSVKVASALKGNVIPLRITEVPYIKHEHDELPLHVFKRNPGLRLIDCTACHKKAMQGSYEEDEIDIPGVGSWED